ncbi:MAG: hypothetical protein ACE37B_10385 [Ilumatobacter sp.]|uniref:hypothetical protein n=1 Tax=Ilumatobacter sp. TaxID=1967498 RepID=UPI00391CE288
MITTLTTTTTIERVIGRVRTPMASMAAAAHAAAYAFAAPTVAAFAGATTWLGLNASCSSGNSMATKRIHPGRLGGVT